MSTIQIRIDEKTKREANKIFHQLGIDMSTGIKIFLKQVIVKKGIPFKVITENGFTLGEELRILKSAKDAEEGIGVTGPMEPEEAIAYLKSLAQKRRK